MIYLFGILAGIINGVFASGAGQIIVFALIFVMQLDTHESRATSILCIGLVTIVTIIRYLGFTKLNYIKIIEVTIGGLLFGIVGSKIMKKIPANVLNISSGIIIVVFSIYSLVVE